MYKSTTGPRGSQYSFRLPRHWTIPSYRQSLQVQENDDTSITNGEVVDNDNVASEGGEKKDSGDNLEGGADPNSPSTVDPSATLGPVDDEPGRLEQQQAAAGGEKASSSPGDGNLSSTLENATGNVYELQEKAPRRELLTGELAVAVSGHWRAAEQQFEGTARQVRSKI